MEHLEKKIDFVFLDSGTGGIPYMLDLKEKCPNATCIYVGDTAHFPYGEKSESKIISCAQNVVQHVIEKWQPRTIVIACNTMSVTALSALRTQFPNIPFVGTVPAIRLAGRESKNRKIGLLATNATVQHQYTQKLIDDFASDCVVEKRGDPALVAFVEHRLFFATEAEKEEAVKPAVDFFAEKNCDTIILGCTHFTHIADTMRKVAGKNVHVIDSRNGVSCRALDVAFQGMPLTEISEKQCANDESFFVTKQPSTAEEIEYKTLCAHFGIKWGGTMQFSVR